MINYKIILWLFSLVFCLNSFSSYSQCIFKGPLNSLSVSNNSAIGSLSWSGLSNADSSDNNYTSSGSFVGILGSTQTNYINATNYGFSIPATATVCGISVTMERNASGLLVGSSIKDNNVYIIKGGASVGTNHALGGAWSASDGLTAYGGSGDTWGTTWTPADINASNFGVAISASLNAGLASLVLTANIDVISINVFYVASPLPIEMLSFNGKLEGDKVKLEWQTASEINSHYFFVEKMNSQYEWSTIGKLVGAGTSADFHSYESYDNELADINYYRIKQVDYDDSFAYSPIISVDHNPKKTDALTIYPIPATAYLHIEARDKIETIELISDNGIVSLTETQLNEDHELNVSGLAAGLYMMKVYTDKDVLVKKFIKE